MKQLEETLKERGSRYGSFEEHSRVAQDLKEGAQSSPNYSSLPLWSKEAIEMILHKIARIINGDPRYKDNWHDIQGYAKLAEDLCDKD